MAPRRWAHMFVPKADPAGSDDHRDDGSLHVERDTVTA